MSNAYRKINYNLLKTLLLKSIGEETKHNWDIDKNTIKNNRQVEEVLKGIA